MLSSLALRATGDTRPVQRRIRATEARIDDDLRPAVAAALRRLLSPETAVRMALGEFEEDVDA